MTRTTHQFDPFKAREANQAVISCSYREISRRVHFSCIMGHKGDEVAVGDELANQKEQKNEDREFPNRKIKWLIYTVAVGLLPILSRVLVWTVTKPGTVTLLNASDFVAFGLVLHISNFNEIEHISSTNYTWKTVQNGVSISFVVFYSVLYALTLLSSAQTGLIDANLIRNFTVMLSIVSFVISYSVFDRISKLG